MSHKIFRISLAGLLLAAMAGALPASAQEGGGDGSATIPSVSQLAGPGEGLEAAISGGSYRLGPGDGLTISVWAPRPIVHELMINLEGKLLIPSVGELDLDGLLLDDARLLVTEALLRHFHDVEVTVSLTRLRRFQVHVLGQVERPGTYLGTAVDRVSAAVGWAGGLSESASQRRIILVSGDSVRAQADLFVFLHRGIPKSNPWLRDGDIVYVPYSRDKFSVQGAVNAPGAYEFLKGDRFSEALSYAGGLTPEAFRDTIEVARYLGPARHAVRFFAVRNGDLLVARPQDEPYLPAVTGYFTIEQGSGATSEFPDFELQSDDIVFVRSVPEYRVKRLVQLEGEVVYPGSYAIDEGETRILDVVARAGGVTEEAFLPEATLVRREAIRLEDREYERLKIVPPADMTEDEYEYFKLRSRENPGLMVVDFERLLLGGDEAQNVLLRSGDLISVPTRRDFVSVLGMVADPGNVLHSPGYDPEDYIRLAGGFAEKADKGKARVIRAAGGEWISLKDVDGIEAGDTIWVPEKPERQFWQTFKDIIAVTTQIVTIYLVVDRALAN